MKIALQRRARELGFDLCRITTAEPTAGGRHLAAWLAAGCHGEMGWLARNLERRRDPRIVLPDARSIVCLAVSYHAGKTAEGEASSLPRRLGAAGLQASTGHAGNADPVPSPGETCGNPVGPVSSPGVPPGGASRGLKNEPSIPAAGAAGAPTGVVARYARYADYHDVLAAPLRELSGFLDALGGPDTRSLWYMDTGPILERELAQRAGLGFIGKHTNLISRTLGNWFFLAEILTTLPLPPDPPEPNRCGACTRCLAACPTSAITAPFQLDARRCISYLTIELKGPIPEPLRPAIGARLFGCDDCLEVCPWNCFAQAGRLLAPHRQTGLERPDLRELLALDAAAFKARFAGTPVLRSKRRGLLRNVAVALGNVGAAADLPALERAARDPEPLIAEHAAWAIGQICGRHAADSSRRENRRPVAADQNASARLEKPDGESGD